MTERLSTIRVTRRYGAPAARVFGAWLDPRVAGKWLFATASSPMARVAIDPRVDGSFSFAERRHRGAVEYKGMYTEITPPRRLAFTLSVDPHSMAMTRVIVEIAPSKEGSEVKLIHERVPLSRASRTEGRWTGILYGLGVILDANLDRNRLKKKARLPVATLLNSVNANRLQAARKDRYQPKEMRT